ncbi:methyltransferase domain-containing protein [Candidatus Woesearchaeota archaeon]|nr:methyltransferase domain-containing protein [Candidatus Woesearchaeota archaeon]
MVFQKLLLHHKTGKKFLVKDASLDYHTEFGSILSAELKSKKAVVESNRGEAFSVLTPSFTDLWEQLQRGPQVIVQKDIGLILAKTGANGSFRVVDAGGGSGSLCFSLANVCKEVTVYEVNQDHYKLLVKNKELFGMKNVHLKQKSIYEEIEEKELDLITLDLPEPWKAMLHVEKALKSGGFLVVYAPQLTQVQQFYSSVRGTGIKILETVELLERQWKVEERILRPEHEMLGHTGFLVLGRKM